MTFVQGLILGLLLGYAIGALVVLIAVLKDKTRGNWKEWFAVFFVLFVWPLFVFDVLMDWDRGKKRL